MKGQLIAAALTLLLPAILIGVAIAYFASNPIVILVLVITMMMGMLYLLSYPEIFTGSSAA